MKKIFAILFLLVFSSFVFAQTRPQTVTDFYLLLPEGLSGITATSKSDLPAFEGSFIFAANKKGGSKSAIDGYRKSLIKIEDLKNGYLYLEGMWEGWAEIALFKKADGTYLVAFSQVGCGPGCEGDIMFLTYNRGDWTNVTKQVFPFTYSYNDGYFKLPRAGTNLELHGGEDCGADVDCENRQKAAVFKWDKTKFIKLE
jgi:hypothetical protein